jgi:2-polyprenyl-3-methyl-5-hydroxy-6-metoxy-1,4-benzoquinol methylase
MSGMTNCPICKSTAVELRFNGFTNRDPADQTVWPVFECSDCKHGFINPQPDATTLNHYYSASYEAYDERHAAEGDDASVIVAAKAQGEFRHIPIPTGKKVLDFGCGGGFFLNICRQLGADVHGIEPSRYGADITRRQGIPVFEGSLDDYLAEHGDERFDVITSNHVIEHVPDPVATLSGLRGLLAPSGLMTITVPNAASTFAKALGELWHSTDLPFHLHQFSPDSLKKAADRAGLTTAELGTTSLPAGTAASLRLLLRRKYFVPQKLSARIPVIDRYSEQLAKRQDAESRGEAIIARFT